MNAPFYRNFDVNSNGVETQMQQNINNNMVEIINSLRFGNTQQSFENDGIATR